MTKYGLYVPFNFGKHFSRIQTEKLAFIGLIIYTFLLNPIILFSQNVPHPSFRHYTTDDGLASPEVYHVLQDKKGYIWIATDNGVSRFDGYDFRNYSKASLKRRIKIKL